MARDQAAPGEPMLNPRTVRIVALAAAAALAASVIAWFIVAAASGARPRHVAAQIALLVLDGVCVAVVTHYRRTGGQ